MRVYATVHAAERFVERVRPGMSVKAGGLELERLVREFGRVVPAPAWMRDQLGVVYVEISDGVVVAVAGGRAVTVGVRCVVSPAQRARWAAVRSAKRSAKRARGRRDPRGGRVGAGE